MDKKTRLLNCIDNKPIDKVPFTFWHHYAGDDAVGKACVAAHKKLYDEVDLDFIKMMSDNYFPMNVGVDKITTPADWDKVGPPKMDSEWVQGQVDRVKWMIEAIKDEACVYYVVFAAVTFVRQALGNDAVLDGLRNPASREKAVAALNRMGDFIAEFETKLIVDGGATGIHQSMSSNMKGLFTAGEYQDWVAPQDWKSMNAVNKVSNYNIVHLCGWDGIKNHLEENWLDYKGAVLHWDQHTDKLPITEAKVILKKNARALMAGFDNKVGTAFYVESKDYVKAVTKGYVQCGGKTGFIMSSDCSMSPETPYERFRWVNEALKEIGG